MTRTSQPLGLVIWSTWPSHPKGVQSEQQITE